jgi:NAD+ synthase (glutamine-hydrolysing)
MNAHPTLIEALKTVRTKRGFDVSSWVNQKCGMLNDYMKKSGLKACVVSCSGGVDSSCTLALLLHAQKMPDSPIKKILAIAQPIHSTKSIQDRAYEVCKAMGVDIITVDQSEAHTKLSKQVSSAMNIPQTAFADGNLRSYMRTPVNYYACQLLASQGLPAIVMGTGNQDEDGYLMYFSKAGDGVCDVQLIADLHKHEVFVVGKHLGVPKSVLDAAPSADLWEGQTDENEMGVTYDFVELYTEWLQFTDDEKRKLLDSFSPEAKQFFHENGRKIEDINRRNRHKMNCPLNLNIIPCTLAKI